MVRSPVLLSLPRPRPRLPRRLATSVVVCLALLSAAGCGGDAEDPSDGSSPPAAPEPSVSPGATSEAVGPASDAEDADDLAADGGWRTTYGTMTFTVEGTVFEGSYDSEDGQLAGTVRPDEAARVVTGEWYEPSSAQACDEERGDTLYWGTFTFVFNADADAFEGTWGYCGETESSSWDGARIADLAADPAEAAEPGESGEQAPGFLIDEAVVEAADVFVALTEDQVVSPTDASAEAADTVRGEATLTFDGDLVEVVVAVELAPGDVAIGACLCVGEPGLDGPAYVDLGTFAPGSPDGQAVWIDELELPDVATAYRDGDLGRFYVEVVTENGPAGLVRGQLDQR